MKNNKIVVLDIGRVVVEFRPDLTLFALGFNKEKINPETIREIANLKCYLDYEKGFIPLEEFHKLFIQKYHLTTSIVDFKKAWHEALPKLVGQIDQVIEKYKKKTVFYALSNINDVLHTFIMTEYPIMREFKKIYTSYELKMAKPNPNIYSYLINDLKIDTPSNLLFIDDIEENLIPARKLGIIAEKSRNSSEKTDEIISKFLK